MSENKIPFTENTRLAKRIAAGVVALSILVIGPVKLKGLRNEAMDVFKFGTSKEYTASVYTDLTRAADSANVLAGLSGSEKLKKLAEKLKKEDDPADMLEIFDELKTEADDVYTAFTRTNPGEAEMRDANGAIKQITSAFNTITSDTFWSYADKFNSARKGFPASLLAMLSGAKKLPEGK